VRLTLCVADLLRAARSGIMTPMLKAAVVLIALLSLGLGACEREQKGISQDLPAVRATKARADAQAIASAVRQYQATFGTLPESISALCEARTASGVTGGPFLARVPAPPAGFTAYEYAKQGDVNFTITSSAGAVTVTAP
jgi:Type II secretion system (T2SS), protein G